MNKNGDEMIKLRLAIHQKSNRTCFLVIESTDSISKYAVYNLIHFFELKQINRATGSKIIFLNCYVAHHICFHMQLKEYN